MVYSKARAWKMQHEPTVSHGVSASKEKLKKMIGGISKRYRKPL